MIRKNPWAIYAGILLVLTCIFFGEFFTKGYLLEGTGDRIESMVPLELYAMRSLKAGHMPEWNPHLWCGVTYIGTGYHNFFYPSQFLIYLMPERFFLSLLTLSAIAHTFLACVFFMMFAFSVYRYRFWAFLGGIAYGFSFTLTYNMNYGNDCHIALVLLPLLLYLVNTTGSRGALKNFLLLTGVSALTVVSGNIQLIFYVLSLTALYAAFKTFFGPDRPRLRAGPLPVTCAAMLAAALLTAARTLPFLASAQDFSGAFTSTFEELARFDLTRPIALVRLFTPFFISGDEGFFMGGLGPPISFNIYLGLIPAYLAVFAVVFVWDSENVFWKSAFLVIVGIILGTPLAKLQYLLMGKTYLSFSRYAWLIPVPLSMMFVSAGVRISGSRRDFIRAIVFSCALFAALTAFLFIFRHNTSDIISKMEIVRHPFFMEKKDLIFSMLRNMKFSIYYFLIGSAYVLVFFIFSLYRYGTRRLFNRIFITTFLAIDLLSMSRANITSLWTFLSPDPFGRVTAQEKAVAEKFAESGKDFRVTADTKNTRLDGLIRLGLYKPSGWGVTIPRDTAFLYRMEKVNRINTMDRFPEDKRTLDVTSVALKMFPDGSVYPNPGYIPRASLYTAYTVIPGMDKARETLLSASFDAHKTLVLEKDPGPGITGGAAGNARIAEDNGNSLRVSTESPGAALLFITDNYNRGWTAYVDGKKVQLYRADVAFKAVRVPAGRHEVLLVYRQPWLRQGLMISVVSLSGLVLLIICRLIAGRRKQK